MDETRQEGIKTTFTKYGLFQAAYYYWMSNHIIYGKTGLRHKSEKRGWQENPKLPNGIGTAHCYSWRTGLNAKIAASITFIIVLHIIL